MNNNFSDIGFFWQLFLLKFTLIFLRLTPHIFSFGFIIVPRFRLVSDCVWVGANRLSYISLSELSLISNGRWNIGRFWGTFDLLGIRTSNQEYEPKYEENSYLHCQKFINKGNQWNQILPSLSIVNLKLFDIVQLGHHFNQIIIFLI